MPAAMGCTATCHPEGAVATEGSPCKQWQILQSPRAPSERQALELASGEKPGGSAAGTDFQSNWFRALRAVALVCGSIAVHVHANIHVAARELHAHKATASVRGLPVTLALP